MLGKTNGSGKSTDNEFYNVNLNTIFHLIIPEPKQKKMSSDESMDSKPSSSPEEETEENIEPPAFGPAALGLHRVGTILPPRKAPTQPIQVLNARGMPARIRKKNKLFFDDDIVNDAKPIKPVSPVKRLLKPVTPIKTPSKIMKKRKIVPPSRYSKPKEEPQEEVKSETKKAPPGVEINPIDRKIGQKLGLRLRNLLKLPKAHKFVSYEWFYSNLDKALFEGDTDFQICLKESFPQLKTRKLTRVEWSRIRQIMGKPRRCSRAFFQEERRELERKREKIRILQSKKNCDVSFVKDLPCEIPLPLTVGTSVTARLRHPQDGLFSGTVEAVDSLASSYRITFDRPGLGTQTIPDFEVQSNGQYDTIPLQSLTQKFRPKANATLYMSSQFRKPMNKGDPLLASTDGTLPVHKIVYPKETIGGFPLKLLELVIRMKKTLAAKSERLNRLQEMNSEAEMFKSYGESFSEDYQRKYAGCVIGMEKMNRDMQEYLNSIQVYSKHLGREPQVAAMLTPSYLREKCRQFGDETFQKNNNSVITNERMTKLVTDLTMILWVGNSLSNPEDNSQVLQVLEGCMEDFKNNLDSTNVEVFQKSVQIHLHHIQLGLRQMISKAGNN